MQKLGWVVEHSCLIVGHKHLKTTNELWVCLSVLVLPLPCSVRLDCAIYLMSKIIPSNYQLAVFSFTRVLDAVFRSIAVGLVMTASACTTHSRFALYQYDATALSGEHWSDWKRRIRERRRQKGTEREKRRVRQRKCFGNNSSHFSVRASKLLF